MSLYLMLTVVLAASGLVMAAMQWAYVSGYGQGHRIRPGARSVVSGAEFRRSAVLNTAVSIALVYGLTWALYPVLFHAQAASPLRILGEGTAVLLLFDFFYYLLHRYAFHEWRPLKRVHAVHHIVRNPAAVDSLYLHPLETGLGLALLWMVAGIVRAVAGPVSVYSFAWAFLVYSVLNVVVHCGLKMRVFPLSLISHSATRHNEHHMSMKGQNFASVTPIWDKVFGTDVAH